MTTTVDAGLDFGSTFSTISAVVNGKFVELSLNGSPYIPTEMAIFNGNQIVIGATAKLISNKSKDYAIYYDLKRWVGVTSQNFNEIHRKLNPAYNCYFSDGDCQMYGIGPSKKPYPVKTLIYYYIKTMISLFQSNYSIVVANINVSVPADYSTIQRTYQKSLLRELGVQLNQIVNEPSAAAIFACYLDPSASDIIMYDFGGGTFDVSYVKRLGKIISVVDTVGDLYLGGRDIDASLGKELTKRTGHVFSPFVLAQIKERLSVTTHTIHEFPSKAGKAIKFTFSGDELDNIARPYVRRSMQLVDKLISNNNITSTTIVMVGGSSLLNESFNQVKAYADAHSFKLIRDDNLRLSVSYGCSALFDLNEQSGFTYIDVNSHPLFDIGTNFDPSVVVRKPMPIPYTHQVRHWNTNLMNTAVCVYEGDDPWFLNDEVLVKAEYRNDEVSRLGEGYNVVYEYSVDGDITTAITSLDGKRRKKIENLLKSEFKLVKIDLIQTQLPSSTEGVVLVDLLKHHKKGGVYEALDLELPYLVNAEIEKLGGIEKLYNELRQCVDFV
nr:heat shock protein 70 [Agapanthus velarivirus]QVY47403.1 heat shock protein 70 [Agapanthus velarivirus]